MRTWDLFAELPVRIDRYDLEGLLYDGAGEERRTTLVWLYGGGHSGVGEDVNYFPDEQLAFQATGDELPLAGEWRFAELTRRLVSLPLFDGTPEYPGSTRYRRWAFESAALDLALRQAGTGLCERLAREGRPLRFVASMPLDDKAALERLRSLHRARPKLELKLDAGPFWSAAIVDELAAMDRVRIVDFKGAYPDWPLRHPADPELYERVIDELPDAILEDPHRIPELEGVLAAHRDRVSWDAPIRGVADLERLDHAPAAINIKPSRIGSLEGLLDTYDWCAAHRVDVYGGGQFELGAGRGQIQLLASLLHPDAPNDVAPVAFNTVGCLDRLPASPLPPRQRVPGFR